MKFVVDVPALDAFPQFARLDDKAAEAEVKKALFAFGITPRMLEVLGVFHEEQETE